MLRPEQSTPDDRLTAALVEIEHFVGHGGWDQPARLFALAPTAELIAAEPSLAEQLANHPADGLSSVEQEGFHPGSDLLTALARISWPPSVVGCALACERSMLPAQDELELPEDPDQAAEFVARHPQRRDIRVVVGALRDGSSYGLARVRTQPDELLAGADLVPALSHALLRTLEPVSDSAPDSSFEEASSTQQPSDPAQPNNPAQPSNPAQQGESQ